MPYGIKGVPPKGPRDRKQADLMTKPLESAVQDKLMNQLGLIVLEGRAASAPVLISSFEGGCAESGEQQGGADVDSPDVLVDNVCIDQSDMADALASELDKVCIDQANIDDEGNSGIDKACIDQNNIADEHCESSIVEDSGNLCMYYLNVAFVFFVLLITCIAAIPILLLMNAWLLPRLGPRRGTRGKHALVCVSVFSCSWYRSFPSGIYCSGDDEKREDGCNVHGFEVKNDTVRMRVIREDASKDVIHGAQTCWQDGCVSLSDSDPCCAGKFFRSLVRSLGSGNVLDCELFLLLDCSFMFWGRIMFREAVWTFFVQRDL